MARVVPCILVLLAASSPGLAQAELWYHPRCRPFPSPKPGPFVRLADGSLLAVQRNATCVSADGGKTWSDPRPMSEGAKPGVPAPGPVVRTRSGVIVLVYMDLDDHRFSWEPGTDALEADLDVWSIRSLDEGKTWVDRQRVLDGYCGSLQNMIETESGRLVAPVQDALRGPVRHAQYVFFSTDDGKTWGHSNLIDLGGHGDHAGGFEGTVEQLTDGRLLMLLRTNLDRFWEAFSEDDGCYWREMRPSTLDASTSPGFLKRLASGRLLLVWNRLYPEGLSEEEKAKYPRRAAGPQHEVAASWHRGEVSLAFSTDDGRTWTEPVVIARQRGGNLSYPYVFEYQPGELWIEAGAARLSLAEQDFASR